MNVRQFGMTGGLINGGSVAPRAGSFPGPASRQKRVPIAVRMGNKELYNPILDPCKARFQKGLTTARMTIRTISTAGTSLMIR